MTFHFHGEEPGYRLIVEGGKSTLIKIDNNDMRPSIVERVEFPTRVLFRLVLGAITHNLNSVR